MKELKEKINATMQESLEAFATYKNSSGAEKAAFLRQIAEEIMALDSTLVDTVVRESNLPEGRIVGERGRTVMQLNKFADLVEEGSWLDAVIEVGDPSRTPLPKPDLRKMNFPIGPVVVFGAGNFPLAFSVAGGDTASALAAGNPVVVKAHPAHPETSLLVAQAIKSALAKCNLPSGIFDLVSEDGILPGELLVKHPITKAVGFTGSEVAGLALYKIATEREEPIPVFAEMGSINPVVVSPEKLASDAEAIASNLVDSVNLGAGQFCTNPGLIITAKTEGFDQFVATISQKVKSASPSKMFSASVFRNYELNKGKMVASTEVSVIETGTNAETDYAVPVIAKVSAADFIEHPTLHQEVFGPFSLVVVCENASEMKAVISSLKGQLTATLYATESELNNDKAWVDLLREKCGRLLFGGVPTGVEVCSAMQHGGPFPSTTDSRFYFGGNCRNSAFRASNRISRCTPINSS